MARAYYYNGEPEFPKLAILFKSSPIKTESVSASKTQVILISDSTNSPDGGNRGLGTHAKACTKAHKATSGEGSDSVCSPLITGPRRKLFTEDGESEMQRQHEASEPDGALRRRLEMAPPPRPNNSKASPHGSSCESSSPTTWWRKYGQ